LGRMLSRIQLDQWSETPYKHIIKTNLITSSYLPQIGKT